jgi:hypothetical protein
MREDEDEAEGAVVDEDEGEDKEMDCFASVFRVL